MTIAAGVGAMVVVYQRALPGEVETVLEVGKLAVKAPGLHVVVD